MNGFRLTRTNLSRDLEPRDRDRRQDSRPGVYANEYAEIPGALSRNRPLLNRMLKLVECETIRHVAVADAGRLSAFRAILRRLANGGIDESGATSAVTAAFSAPGLRAEDRGQGFGAGWERRLVRFQFSRFYNQAVLEHLLDQRSAICLVPRSSEERPAEPCTALLAGRRQHVSVLHEGLVEAFRHGRLSREPTVPNHPECTHVARAVPGRG